VSAEKSDWKRYTLTQNVDCVRDGWRGVWDAVVAAVTNRPRRVNARPMTFSVYADKPVHLKMTQVELGDIRCEVKDE